MQNITFALLITGGGIALFRIERIPFGLRILLMIAATLGVISLLPGAFETIAQMDKKYEIRGSMSRWITERQKKVEAARPNCAAIAYSISGPVGLSWGSKDCDRVLENAMSRCANCRGYVLGPSVHALIRCSSNGWEGTFAGSGDTWPLAEQSAYESAWQTYRFKRETCRRAVIVHPDRGKIG